MKKLLILAIGLVLACNSAQKTSTLGDSAADADAQSIDMSTTYAATITQGELKKHLFTYASDEFEGRETGKAGQKKAVEYIKAQYKAMGIPAAKGDGDYFQKVPLEMAKLPTGTITANGDLYTIGEDFLTFSGAEGNYDEIVYVGYGIQEGDYSDYKDLDVSGKVVLVKFGEPMDADGAFVLSGTDKKSVWSNVSESIGKRTQIATEKGAKGLLYYDTANYARYKGYYDYMKSNNSGNMGIKSDDDDPALIVLNTSMAKAVYSNIEEDSEPKSLKATITLNLASANDEISTENVAAILRGSEKPNEYRYCFISLGPYRSYC